MARKFIRAQRVAQEMQKNISIILHQKIKDPRIKMITISRVEVSRDLAYAKVFITFLNTLDQRKEITIVKNSIKVLNGNMAKHVRFLLGKAMRLRVIPELTFFYDTCLIKGIRMFNLISNIIQDDEKRRYLLKDKRAGNEVSS